MARKSRGAFPCALYHVFATGARSFFLTARIFPRISNTLNASHRGFVSGAMRLS